MALDILESIRLNAGDLKDLVTVHAVQYDNARRVKAQLLNGGEKWVVPSGAKAVVSFKKSDNIGGFYDVTDLGETAVSYDTDRSIIYIKFDVQVLTTTGNVDVQVNFYQNKQRLSTFSFHVDVQASVVRSYEVSSNWLFNILSQEIASTLNVATTPEAMRQWLDENIKTSVQAGKYAIDNSLTLPDYAAEALATGKMVTVSDANPNVVANKVWVKKTGYKIDIPVLDDVAQQWSDPSMWAIGHIMSRDGTVIYPPNEVYKRICTPYVIPENVRAINVPEGYQVWVYCYDRLGNYLGIWDGIQPKKEWMQNANFRDYINLNEISTEYRYKLLANGIDATIQLTPEDDGSKIKFVEFTDNTLTKKSVAADSKTVGDFVSSVKENFSIITKDDFESGGLYQATGLPYWTPNFKTKDFIPFNDDVYVIITSESQVENENGTINVFFYDENMTKVGNSSTIYKTIGIHKVYATVPCSYIKFMIRSDSCNPKALDGVYICREDSPFYDMMRLNDKRGFKNKYLWQHKYIYYDEKDGTIGAFQADENKYSVCSYDIPIGQYQLLQVDGVDNAIENGHITGALIFYYDKDDNYISFQWLYYILKNVTYKFYDHVTPFGTAYIKIQMVSKGSNVEIPIELGDLISFKTEEYCSDFRYKNNCHGIKEIDVEYIDKQCGIYDGFMRNDLNITTSKMYKMPIDGLRVYHTDAAHHQMKFYNKNADGQFIPAVNYSYCYYNTDSVGEFNGRSVYYPYEENLYFIINVKKWTKNIVPKEHVHLVTGHIFENGGRLPNLQPTSIYVSKETDDFNREGQKLCILGGGEWNKINPNSDWIYTIGAYMHSYCSILRLKDINRIVVNPKYNMVARIYKINNNDKTAEIYDDIFSIGESTTYRNNDTNLFLSYYISGVNIIDFSNYNFEGIVVIGIQCSPEELTIPPSTLSANNQGHGILSNYQEVYNSVFVEWKPGVSVCYDGNIPAIVKKNIDTIINIPFIAQYPETLYSDSGYGNWSMASDAARKPLPNMPGNKVSGWWYCGSNYYNAPFMHVSPKSFITASKNPHSRVYVPLNAGGTSYNNLYGTVCSSTSSLVCGYPSGNETFTICCKELPQLTYHELETIESFQAGELFASGDFLPKEGDEAAKGEYGHVVYITEVVRINGEVFCVNAFENSQPMIRFRTFTNMSAYDGYSTIKVGEKVDEINNIAKYENEINIFTFFSYEGYMVNRPYAMLGRPKPQYYKSFRDAYGPYDFEDYPVTSIMCDRGTDSVYCLGEAMTLTVTDGTTNIVLKTGNNSRNINLEDYQVMARYDNDSVTVYDVTGMVGENDSPGYYQIIVNNKVMESFFVPKNRHLFCERDYDNNTITAYFDPSEENDEVVSVAIDYYNENDKTYRPYYYFADLDFETTITKTIPKTDIEIEVCTFTSKRLAMGCDGLERRAVQARLLRKTPYGTYSLLYHCQSETLRQKAGII